MSLPIFTAIPFSFLNAAQLERSESASSMHTAFTPSPSFSSSTPTPLTSPSSFASTTPSPLSQKKRKKIEDDRSSTTAVSRKLFQPYSFDNLINALRNGVPSEIKKELALISNSQNKYQIFGFSGAELTKILIPFIRYEEVLDFMENSFLAYLIQNQDNYSRIEVLQILWLICQTEKNPSVTKSLEINNTERNNLFRVLGFCLLSNSNEPTWRADLEESGLVIEIFNSSLWIQMLQYSQPVIDTLPSEGERKESESKFKDSLFLQHQCQEKPVCSTNLRFFSLIFNMREGADAIHAVLRDCVENAKRFSKTQKKVARASADERAKNQHVFNLVLKSVANLTKEVVDNKNTLIVSNLNLAISLRNIFAPELVNELDFHELIEEDSVDLLSMFERLPELYVPQCRIILKEVVLRIVQQSLAVTSIDLWRLNLSVSTSAALYSFYKKLDEAQRPVFVNSFLLQPNLQLISKFLTEDCTSEDFVNIYGMLSRTTQNELLKYLLQGVDEAFFRCSSLEPTKTVDLQWSCLEEEDGAEYTEFTENFRTTDLFLARATTSDSAISAHADLQQDIAKILATKSNECLIKFFAKVQVGNPHPLSFFNVLFGKILSPERIGEIASDTFNELVGITEKAKKAGITTPLRLKERGHLITQILFCSHKSTCQRLLQQFEARIGHMGRVGNSPSIPYTFYVFKFLLTNYLHGRENPNRHFEVYEAIENSLIQNMSPTIRNDFLKYLKAEKNHTIRAFLAWRNIDALKKENAPKSYWISHIAIYLDIILFDRELEETFLGASSNDKPDYEEDLFGITFSTKRQLSYQQLVDHLIPREILNEVIEELSHSRFPAQKRFCHWLKEYKKS